MVAGVVIATNSSVPVTCTAPVAGGEAAGASGLEDIAAPLVTTTSGDGLGAEDVRVVGEAVAAAMHPARSEVQAKPTNSQRPASRVLIVSTPRDARRGRSRQQPGTVPAARVWAAPRCLQRAVEHPPRAAHGQAPSATLTVRTPERACARLARGRGAPGGLRARTNNKPGNRAERLWRSDAARQTVGVDGVAHRPQVTG
jgi:hypothetical protein